jgi:hypothetical protein
VVMVLQRLEGLRAREAADRFAFDVRWRYAAGVADAVAGEETASFASTVLVDFRARLRASADPDRIFRVTCELARQVGLVGVRRVLDSAPLEDAVATQDTVTMLRGAIGGLLRACPSPLAAKWLPPEVRRGLRWSGLVVTLCADGQMSGLLRYRPQAQSKASWGAPAKPPVGSTESS